MSWEKARKNRPGSLAVDYAAEVSEELSAAAGRRCAWWTAGKAEGSNWNTTDATTGKR